MKNKGLTLACLLAASTLSHAAVGYFGNFYVILDTGSGNTFYQTTNANSLTNAGGGFNTAPDGFNPAFTGADLGLFDPSSQSLTLKGFEMNTFNDSGDSVNNAGLSFSIWELGGGSAIASGGVTKNTPNSVSGNDKFWQLTTDNVDLLAGLPNGDYELRIFVSNDASFTSGGGGTFTMYNWNTGSRPTATFTVVPEPSIALLGGLGLLGLLRRRR